MTARDRQLVDRVDLPPRPAEAEGVFGARVELAERYAAWLCGVGLLEGHLGPREAPRVWARHVLNCAAPARLLAPGCTVADIGAGAGLPGIPIALARPDVSVTLIEPMLRRTNFLDRVVADLQLDGVTVLRGRAELLEPLMVDAVVSRAVARLDRVWEWSARHLAPGGRVLALKGESASTELAELSARLRQRGVTHSRVHHVALPDSGATTVVVELRGTLPGPRRPSRRQGRSR